MRLRLLLVLCALGWAGAQRAYAQRTPGPLLRLEYPVPVSLEEALLDLAGQAGLDLVFAHSLLEGLSTDGVWEGREAADGLDVLLDGTDIRARRVGPRQFVLVPAAEGRPPDGQQERSGRVVDAGGGWALPGAHVVSLTTGAGRITDLDGRFRLPPGAATLRVSYVGYRVRIVEVEAGEGELTVALRSEPIVGDGVEVERGNEPAVGPGVGRIGKGSLEPDVSALPAFLGEPDLFQALEGLPGVQRSGEAGGELVVRGAEGHYNRYLIDGAPMLNPFHSFGLFSTFQPETVESARLHKGTLPAEYGSALASVLEVESTSGLRSFDADRAPHGAAAISPIAVRATIEAPLGERVGIVASARRSYLDLLLAPSLRPQDRLTVTGGAPAGENVGYGFYDAGGKVTWRPEAGNETSASAYFSADAMDTESRLFGAPTSIGYRWHNALASVRRRQPISRAVFVEATAYVTSYQADERYFGSVPAGQELPFPVSFSLSNDVAFTEVGVRADADYFRSLRHRIRVGGQAMGRWFRGAVESELALGSVGDDGTSTESKRDNQRAFEGALYGQDEWWVSDRSLLRPGIRLEAYNSEGRWELAALPRLQLRYTAVPGRLFFHGGMSRHRQTLHRLRSLYAPSLDLAVSRWIPAGQDPKPASAWHLGAGLEWAAAPTLVLTADGFARRFDDVLLAVDGVEGPTEDDVPELVALLSNYRAGRETAVGLELGARWVEGPWSASAAYAASRTRATLSGSEMPRPARYDVPHQLIVVGQRRGQRASAAFALTLRSGRPLQPGSFDTLFDEQSGRLPLYVRLDLSAGYRFRAAGLTWELQAQAYNATGQENVVGVAVVDADGTAADTPGLPLLPMVSLKASW